jgi:hypothetical protein
MAKPAKKEADKKLKLKKQSVRDLDARRGGSVRGGQGGLPPKGGAKPIEPVG